MRTIRYRTRRLARGEGGSSLVEFAIASFMLLTVVFGTLEFGLAVWKYNMVSDLAQEGARWASVNGSSSASACGGTWPVTSPCKASLANVQAYVDSRALGIVVTVATPTNGPPSGLVAGNTVYVQVSSVFTPLTGLVPAGAITLTNTAQMVMPK